VKTPSHRASSHFATGAAAVLLSTFLATVALAQQKNAPPERPGRAPRASIQVIVDGQPKRTWTLAELKELPTVRWINPAGKGVKAIALWTLLTRTGLSREEVAELRVVTNAGANLALKGNELAKADVFALRGSGRGGIDRPLRLVPLDKALEPERGRFLRGGVTRVEVMTVEAMQGEKPSKPEEAPPTDDASKAADAPKPENAPSQ
jgi:hypothetical protein